MQRCRLILLQRFLPSPCQSRFAIKNHSLVVNLNDVVYKVEITSLDEIVFPYSLYLPKRGVLWSLPVSANNHKKTRAFRVNCNYLYFRILFLSRYFPAPLIVPPVPISSNKRNLLFSYLFPHLRPGVRNSLELNILGLLYWSG